MPIITLTSDYGMLDHRVSAIKGSLLSLNPNCKIIDITHEITAYNLLQTAYIVRNTYKHFPKNSVHLISVDTFHHKDRKCIVVKADDHYFITSDNGLMSLIFYDQIPEAIYEITLNNRFDDKVNFTSIDIFVPVAIHLNNGGIPEVIGRKIENYLDLSFPRAVFNEKMIVGEIMYIDNFGNVVSNISKKFFDKAMVNYKKFELKFRNLTIKEIHKNYTDIVRNWENEPEYHGKRSAIFNEMNLLEITIYKGNKNSGAKSLLGLNIGEKIFIEFE